MVHAPEVTDYIKQSATKMDAISDDIDEVNVIKGKKGTYEDESEFDAAKDKAGFRQYEDACDRVKNFYAVRLYILFVAVLWLTRQEQHRKQTLAYNLAMRKEYTEKTRARMSIWQAMEMLNTLVDESDPDTSVGQIEHLLQTAEAMRRDGKPDWMQVTGLIHDLGKLLCFFGADGQWDVVGDTFVVGCKFSDKIIYPETFKENPDINDPKLQTENGIYEAGCGLDNVLLSWGHDEYLYHVVKTQSSRMSLHFRRCTPF
jgi:inositol oxygenase